MFPPNEGTRGLLPASWLWCCHWEFIKFFDVVMFWASPPPTFLSALVETMMWLVWTLVCMQCSHQEHNLDHSCLWRPFFGLPQTAHGDTFSRFVTLTTSLIKLSFIQVSWAMPNNPSLCDIGSGGSARSETFLSPIIQRIQAKTLQQNGDIAVCCKT